MKISKKSYRSSSPSFKKVELKKVIAIEESGKKNTYSFSLRIAKRRSKTVRFHFAIKLPSIIRSNRYRFKSQL